MTTLGLMTLVVIGVVLANTDVERQRAWNHTAELEEKADKWQENKTHIVILKVLTFYIQFLNLLVDKTEQRESEILLVIFETSIAHTIRFTLSPCR